MMYFDFKDSLKQGKQKINGIDVFGEIKLFAEFGIGSQQAGETALAAVGQALEDSAEALSEAANAKTSAQSALTAGQAAQTAANQAKSDSANAVTKANAAITNAKISTLDAGKITTGTLAAARIAAGSITSDKLTISDGFITNAMIANSIIQSAKIATLLHGDGYGDSNQRIDYPCESAHNPLKQRLGRVCVRHHVIIFEQRSDHNGDIADGVKIYKLRRFFVKIKLQNKFLPTLIPFLRGMKLKGEQSRARSKFLALAMTAYYSLHDNEIELLKEYAILDKNGEPLSDKDGGFTIKEDCKSCQTRHRADQLIG